MYIVLRSCLSGRCLIYSHDYEVDVGQAIGQPDATIKRFEQLLEQGTDFER